MFHSGGALITECMILTAASCFTGHNLEELVVVVGDKQRFVKEFSEKTYIIERLFCT